MATAKILVLHRNPHLVLEARRSENYANIPGVEFKHTCIRGKQDADQVAGYRFAAIIGLELVSAEIRAWLITRMRA